MPAPPPDAAPAFELDRATVALGGRAVLRDVSLAVGRGERVALVGPSGAGKTTLLRLLGGALGPDAGAARHAGRGFAERAPAERRAARATVGFVHQDLALVPTLRVLQNVLAGAYGRQGFLRSLRASVWPSRAELLEVHALLERVGVAEKLYQRTDTLSGGQQQRVAIARALFQRPAALLVDEPVAAVDPARAAAIVALLDALARERGLTLVASLHDLALARAHFPRLVGLRAGRVAFDLPTAEVTPERFEALYDLAPEELAADGA